MRFSCNGPIPIANKITMIAGLTEKHLPCLQSLDLHENQLTSTLGINLPSLQKLYLSSNKLTKLEGLAGLRQLTTLHLRGNQIAFLDGFAASMEGLQYINLRSVTVNCFDWPRSRQTAVSVCDVHSL